jgi:hypothetical protein
MSKVMASNLGDRDWLWLRKYRIHATNRPSMPVKKKKMKYQSTVNCIIEILHAIYYNSNYEIMTPGEISNI